MANQLGSPYGSWPASVVCRSWSNPGLRDAAELVCRGDSQPDSAIFSSIPRQEA